MIRTAVVGVGYLGRFHAQKHKLLADCGAAKGGDPNEDIQFAGVFDANAERASEVAQELGVPVLSTLQEVASKADAVTVASTTSTHFEVAKFFLKQKKHVNLEKPMTATEGEARELLQIARDQSVLLSVGHSERFNPCFRELRQRFERPQFVELRRHAPFRRRGSDVSVVLDLMVHDLDMVLNWCDWRDAIVIRSAMGGRTHSETLDWAECVLSAGPQSFHISVSRVAPQMLRTFRGFQGSWSFAADFQTNEVTADEWRAGGETPINKEQHRLDKADHLLLETEAFLRAVRGQAPLEIPGEQGLRVLEMAFAVERLADRSS
ncbi:MAG: hypothetical protein C5B49_14185 [Bdellovibrio sp.]|nr:MAG: hypothetical protein C5B49_14185 [Bdellovibrio sp.]